MPVVAGTGGGGGNNAANSFGYQYAPKLINLFPFVQKMYMFRGWVEGRGL